MKCIIETLSRFPFLVITGQVAPSLKPRIDPLATPRSTEITLVQLGLIGGSCFDDRFALFRFDQEV